MEVQTVRVTTRPDAGYVLGHSDRELERLGRQGALTAPITRQFLTEAGICDGMRKTIEIRTWPASLSVVQAGG